MFIDGNKEENANSSASYLDETVGNHSFPEFFRTNLFRFQIYFWFLLLDSYSLMFLHVEEDKMEP